MPPLIAANPTPRPPTVARQVLDRSTIPTLSEVVLGPRLTGEAANLIHRLTLTAPPLEHQGRKPAHPTIISSRSTRDLSVSRK